MACREGHKHFLGKVISRCVLAYMSRRAAFLSVSQSVSQPQERRREGGRVGRCWRVIGKLLVSTSPLPSLSPSHFFLLAFVLAACLFAWRIKSAVASAWTCTYMEGCVYRRPTQRKSCWT
ncbi:hypothetical protein LX32DRAFT_191179 [Colletotrichum zoysiae]|uniref:Uncharacterized protein n=1 Tax=Colletotrichum zoysiae TaxID=1216348 RepID=A0AAD9LUH4_9PEZI|nr:hypothetical protein LX32DRAFT_191179 [Colletotrichum zoysiae]